MNDLFVKRANCPACASATSHEIYRKPYDQDPMRAYLDSFYADIGRVHHESLAGSDFVLHRCSTCDLVYQYEIPGETLLGRIYEEWMDPEQVFERYEKSHDLRFYVQLERHVEKALRFIGGKPADMKLLDFGMGWGNWCMFVQAFGCKAYGTELSATRVAHAQSRGIGVLAYDDIPQHTFDMINAEQVFEHLTEPLATLKHLAGALRRNGIMWIAVPNGCDIAARLSLADWTAPKGSAKSLNAVAPLEHLNCFNARALVHMAGLAGLDLLEIPHRKVQSSPMLMLRHRAAQSLKRLSGQRHTDLESQDVGTDLFFRKR